MYGRIFGFQRLARCPKWTPASIRSFTWTMATHCPPGPSWDATGPGVRTPPGPAVPARGPRATFKPPRGRGRQYGYGRGMPVAKKVMVAAGRDRVKGFSEKADAPDAPSARALGDGEQVPPAEQVRVAGERVGGREEAGHHQRADL